MAGKPGRWVRCSSPKPASAVREGYASDYPASIGGHMTNGWSPHWYQPIDVYETCSDDDFRLDVHVAQTMLGRDWHHGPIEVTRLERVV